MIVELLPTQKNAAQSEERYRFLFESSPAAVYSIHASGVIQDFPPGALNGIHAALPSRSAFLGSAAS